MQSTSVVALRVLLVLIGIFHIVIAVGLNISSDFPQLVAQYYGAQIDFTPELLYIVKPVGAFMLVVGLMALAAARDPFAHGTIIYGLVLLFAVRGLQRFVFHEEIASSVGIPVSRNIANGIFFLLLGIALFLLFRMAARAASSSA